MHAEHLTIILLVIIVSSSILILGNCFRSNTSTLVLSHVIFRHSNRTPSKSGLWKTNSFYDESFYQPYGYGQLTNEGKLNAYNLGVELRSRYAGFLDEVWNTSLCEARATDYDRVKMSLSLVLGGLFPPKGPVVWNEHIPFQPIPYKVLPVELDMELSSWACTTTLPLIYADETNMEKLKSYDSLMKTLSDHTGEDIDYVTALDIYFGMRNQELYGLPLDLWTTAVYPEPLKSYTVEFYYIETSTNQLKTVLAGYILKKILNDSLNKINGTLKPNGRKLFLYASHEVNVATVMTALQIYNVTDIPPENSYLAFDVHKIDGVYGIKLSYQDHSGKEPRELVLPGCDTFCPIDVFANLIADILPQSQKECFGDK